MFVKTLQCTAEAKPHLVFLELDAENAYNSLQRAHTLAEVYKRVPGLYPYARSMLRRVS